MNGRYQTYANKLKMFYLKLIKDPGLVEKAMELVKKFYSKYYKSYPHELPDYFIAAFDDENSIIGTIGLLVKEPFSNKKLEIEQYFEFSFDSVIDDPQSKTIVSFARWVSTRPDLTIYTIYAGTLLAYYLGAPYEFMFSVEKVIQNLLAKHRLPIEVVEARVKEHVKKGPYREYFTKQKIFITYQQTKLLLDYLEQTYGLPNGQKIEIPQDLNTIKQYKLTSNDA